MNPTVGFEPASGRPSQKRNRVSHNCTNCRRRRQMCDRRTPCASCIRSNNQSTCRYQSATNNTPSRDSNDGPQPVRDNSSQSPSLTLQGLGYSAFNEFNSVGIVRRMNRERVGQFWENQNLDSTITLPLWISKEYIGLLRRLPPRLYLEPLISIYFQEVNWHYSYLEENIFADEFCDFYHYPYASEENESQVKVKGKHLFFPSLLFQMAALAIQFIPETFDVRLNDLRMGHSFDNLSKEYSNSGSEMARLLADNHRDLTSINAELLRIYWLKNQGEVIKCWHSIGKVILELQELGIHRDQERIDEVDTDERVWEVQLRRRLMINIFLWDSEMGMTLGKPMNLNHQDCVIVPPIDASAPPNWKSSFPQARSPNDKPSSFTFRLIEYSLQKKLPEIRALETAGPSANNYGKVQRVYAEALEYVGNLPACFRFDNPDTSFDQECPWIIPQRHYLCAVTWTFVLYLHKPYIFCSSRSRKDAVKTAVLLLHAQKRHFECLLPRHYKLFTLAFMAFEGAVAVLAVLITFPAEHDWYDRDTLLAVNDAFHRLTKMKAKNAMAGPAAEVIRSLLQRAEIRQFMATLDLRSSALTRSSLAPGNQRTHVSLSNDYPTRHDPEIPSFDTEPTLSDGGPYIAHSSRGWAPDTTWTADYLQPTADLINLGYNPPSWCPITMSRQGNESSFDLSIGESSIEGPSSPSRVQDTVQDTPLWHELELSNPSYE